MAKADAILYRLATIHPLAPTTKGASTHDLSTAQLFEVSFDGKPAGPLHLKVIALARWLRVMNSFLRGELASEFFRDWYPWYLQQLDRQLFSAKEMEHLTWLARELDCYPDLDDERSAEGFTSLGVIVEAAREAAGIVARRLTELIETNYV